MSEPDQTRTRYQYTSDLDSMFDDKNPRQFGNHEPSGTPPGGSDMYLDPTRVASNMANQPPGFNINIGTIPTPSVNHGFNPSISSHMVTHQHQWDTGIHFPTSNPSQNNFRTPPFFNHEIYANQADLADLVRQNQSSNAVKSSQCRSAGSTSARLDAIKPPNQAIAPPGTDGDCAPTLTEVNPESGSLTGGARTWLQGTNFLAHLPLFARFGTAVVPTAFINPYTLSCNLPPASAPGVVNVTLSRHPERSAPKYGTSIAKFHCLADYEQLFPMVLRVHAQGYPGDLPALQTLLTALYGNHGNRGLQGGSHGAGPQDDPIEISLVDALSCLQTRPDFHEILSTTNDYSQTFAHLSILYGYPSLLRHLVEWCIDLAISDVNGLTALHCAFMKGDRDSVRILRQGGASETVTDKLGRTPSELGPEKFGSAIGRDGRAAAELDTEIHMGEHDYEEKVALEEQFSTLESRDYSDSGHSQCDPGEFDEDGPESMAADPFTGGNEGGGGGGASGSGGGQIAWSKWPKVSTSGGAGGGSSTSSYSFRSPPLRRPPPVSESVITHPMNRPGHTCAGRGLNIVFYRGDATALPMYGRGDHIEGHIDLKSTKDVCQIEITLEGMLNITFIQYSLPYDQTNVPLFSSTQTVFSSGNGRVPRNTYEFNFEIPTMVPSSRVVLPPTWHFHHPGAEAEVLYQLRVVVTRTGMFFVKKSEKVICKIEYFPRNVPPQNPSLEQGGKKDIELSYNLPPMGKREHTFGRVLTTLTTVLSIPRPLVYASGSIIQYTVAFSCRTSSAVPALLTASVSLLKSHTAILHNRKSSKETVVAKGELQTIDFHPNENGGTRILKGIMVAGREGEELSWKLDGMAEVKYTLRLFVAPRDEFREQFAEFNSLPSFEHRENVTLTTDSVISSREEASWPSRRVTHTPGGVLTRHSSDSTGTASTPLLP